MATRYISLLGTLLVVFLSCMVAMAEEQKPDDIFSISGLNWGMDMEAVQPRIHEHQANARKKAQQFFKRGTEVQDNTPGNPFSTQYSFMAGGLQAVSFFFSGIKDTEVLTIADALEAEIDTRAYRQLESRSPCMGLDNCTRSLWQRDRNTKVLLLMETGEHPRTGVIFIASGVQERLPSEMYANAIMKGHDKAFAARMNESLASLVAEGKLNAPVEYVPHFSERRTEVWGGLAYKGLPPSQEAVQQDTKTAVLLMQQHLAALGIATDGLRFVCRSFTPEGALAEDSLRIVYGTAVLTATAPEWSEWVDQEAGPSFAAGPKNTNILPASAVAPGTTVVGDYADTPNATTDAVTDAHLSPAAFGLVPDSNDQSINGTN